MLFSPTHQRPEIESQGVTTKQRYTRDQTKMSDRTFDKRQKAESTRPAVSCLEGVGGGECGVGRLAKIRPASVAELSRSSGQPLACRHKHPQLPHLLCPADSHRDVRQLTGLLVFTVVELR